MGALYEDVETFFGDIFACYGRAVSRFPHPFTLLPLILCILLGLGIFSIRYETNIEDLYSPINSQAQKDRQQLLKLFDPLKLFADYSKKQTKKRSNASNTEWQTNFKYHQKIHQPTYFEIIVFNKISPSVDLNFQENLKETINTNEHIIKIANITLLDDTNSTNAYTFSTKTTRTQTSSKPELKCLWNSSIQSTQVDEDSFDDNTSFTHTKFTSKSLEAIRSLYKCIANFKSHKTSFYNYFDICLKFNNRCSVDVFELNKSSFSDCAFSTNHFKAIKQPNSALVSKIFLAETESNKSFSKKSSTQKKTFTTSSPSHYTSSNFFQKQSLHTTSQRLSKKNLRAKLPYLKMSPTTRAIKIRFNIKGATRGEARQRHLRWQDAMIEQMKHFNSPLIQASFMASDSLEIELREYVGGDTKYFVLSVVAMLVSATFASSGGRADHVVLAYTGVIAALLTILGTFGLLSLIGTSFVNLCSVMPFLVLGQCYMSSNQLKFI